MFIDETKPARPQRRMIDVKTLADMLDSPCPACGLASPPDHPVPGQDHGGDPLGTDRNRAWIDGLMAPDGDKEA